jgi:hypothetical protein
LEVFRKAIWWTIHFDPAYTEFSFMLTLLKRVKDQEKMSEESRRPAPLFTHIDVTTATATATGSSLVSGGSTNVLLVQLVAAQTRQNELMEQLIQQMSAAQRQRNLELGQWKQANPMLAQRCREAAEMLGQVQTRFLESVTEEITDNGDCMMDGDFMLNEFVDRFGPRLAHLNGVLQVLSQLSSHGGEAAT